MAVMEMKRVDILKKYAHYYDYLQKLGSIPLCKTPTIEDLQPTSGVIQAAYKDIKKYKFDGNLIDYLCWISTLFLIENVEGEDIETFIKACNIRPSFKLYSESRNLLRLANKRPEYFLSAINATDDYEKAYETFASMMCLWYMNYMADLERQQKQKIE